MGEYIFVKIPTLSFFYHHDFINGGHKNDMRGEPTYLNFTNPNHNNVAVRRIRTELWYPDAEPDNITDILTRNMADEIDRQILLDIHTNHRFYQQNSLNEALNRWDRLIEPMVRGYRAPVEMPLTPNEAFIFEQDYMVLPNEEGWYGNGTFDSIFIKMDMRPCNFLKRRRRRRI